MSRRAQVLLLALLLVPVLAAIACGSSPAPAEKPAATPAAETPKPASAVTKDMHDELGRVAYIQRAVVRGDLESAVEPAKWLVDHPDTPGLPADTASYVKDIKKFAGNVAAAKNLAGAASSTAMMVSYCGACHVAAKVTPALPEVPKPTLTSGAVAHMLEHQWAVDLMYQGLIGPSDELWKKGVEALKAAPLSAAELPKDSTLTAEIVANEKKVHDQADKALKTTDMGTKVALYGEVLNACASCHALHGRVWGPGLPTLK